MKPYSQDLRQKIIDTYLEDHESIREIAKRFQVSSSFVQKLLKNYHQTGNINPKPHRGGKSPKLNLQQIDLVNKLIKQHQDATLQELCDMLENQTGVRISRPTMSRITKKKSSKMLLNY
jgi:transposase